MTWSAPPTFVAHAALTAAQLNILGGDLAVLGGAWIDDTATRTSSAIWTTTGASLGNGTLVSRYRLVGKTLDWRLSLTFGSTTSAGSSQLAFAYPASLSALTGGDLVTVRFFDNSATNTFWGQGVMNPGTVNCQAESATPGLGTSANSTTPMTWATNDQLDFSVKSLEVA